MKFYSEAFMSILKASSWSVTGFSKEIGVTRRTVYNWFSGIQKPDEFKTRKIAKLLEVKVCDISDLAEIDRDSYLSSSENNLNIHIEDKDMINESQKFQSLLNGIRNYYENSLQINTVIKALIASVDIIIYVKDINNKYIIANRAFLENVGLKVEYITKGKTDFDFFNSKEASVNNDEDCQIIQTGKHVNCKRKIPGTKNKKEGIISKYPILNSEGKIIGLIAVMEDVTELVKTMRQNKLLENVINQMDDGLWIRREKPESGYLFVSDSFCENFGRTREEIMNNPLLVRDAIHKDDVDNFIRTREIAEKKDTFPLERDCRIVVGREEKWLRVKLFKEQHGNIFYGIFRNVTKEKMDEEKISVMLNFLDRLPEALCIIVYNDSGDGNLIFFNDSMRSFTDKTFDSYNNLEEFWDDILTSNNKKIFLENIRKCIMDHDSYTGSVKFRNSAGQSLMKIVSVLYTERENGKYVFIRLL